MDKKNNNNEISTGKALSIVGGPIGVLVLLTYGSTHYPQATWLIALLLFGIAGVFTLRYISANKEMVEKVARRLEEHQIKQEKKPYFGKLYWLYHRKRYLITVFLFILLIWIEVNDAA